jgi:hypothetical protein
MVLTFSNEIQVQSDRSQLEKVEVYYSKTDNCMKKIKVHLYNRFSLSKSQP